MKSIEYFITEKGQQIVKSPKYLEEEKVILKILLNERKNISEIWEELNKLGFTDLNWHKVKNWIENLEREKLVEVFK